MAANMPVWITKTLDFLGHPRGPPTTSTLALPHELVQSSSYSKALPPLPREGQPERQRLRASKRSRRSRTHSPSPEDDGPTAQKPTVRQETKTMFDYEDRATQTNASHVVQLSQATRPTHHPELSSSNVAPTDVQSAHVRDRSNSSEDIRGSSDQRGVRPKAGVHTTTTHLEDDVANRAESVTSISRKKPDDIHTYHEYSELPTETPLQSPARSYLRAGSVPCLDARAEFEGMDVDGQPMQGSGEEFEGQELLVKDANLENGPPYTERAAQIIRANDGSKDCLALLLTSEMVTKIGQIATRSRRLDFIKRDLRKMKREVEFGTNMIEYKTDALQDTNDQGKVNQINMEIGDTQRRLAAAVKCIDAIEDEILTLTDNLAFSRVQCQEMFEDVLGREDLLQVPDPEHTREVNPTSPCARDYNTEQSAGQTATQNLEARRNEEESMGVESEDVVRRTAKKDFEEKRNIFYTLDEAFEHRQENLAAEKAEYLRRVQEGTCDLTQTEFDLLALKDFQTMTANLKHAEEAFEDAFRRAKQLGVLDEQDAYYQQSVFSEWSGGYPMSMEHAMVRCAPTKRIDYWQDSVDESQGTGLEPWANPELEPEHWEMEDCDIRSVAISDSWSCVDWTRNRRRIDRWRGIAGRDR
ncbi:MAG: hypothetical protein Q9171_005399 [Xanthocarpia ochracea]